LPCSAKRPELYKQKGLKNNIKLLKTDLGFIPLFIAQNLPKAQVVGEVLSKDEILAEILTFRFKTRLYPVAPQFSRKLYKNINSYIRFFISEDQNLKQQNVIFKLDNSFYHPRLRFYAFDKKQLLDNQPRMIKFKLIPLTYWDTFCFDLYKNHSIKIIADRDLDRVYISIDQGDAVWLKVRRSINLKGNYYGYTKIKGHVQFKTELTPIIVTKGIDYTPVAVEPKYPRFSSKHYRKKIKKYNDIDAMYWLGMNYYEGSHGELKDYYQAFYWLKKAVKKKHVLAMYQLGLCYMNGTGITQNDKIAYQYFKKAANYFYSDAVAMCMYYLISGRHKRDVLKPGTKIYKIFKNALGQGNANALFYYDYYFAQHPEFFRLNLKRENIIANIGECMGQSAARGLPKAYYYLATSRAGNDKTRVSMGTWQSDFLNCLKAAELGFIPAYITLGDYYIKGNDKTKNFNHKKNYFYYIPSDSVKKLKKSLQKAFYWYKKAADNASLLGSYKVGCCYALGLGVKRDKKQAKQFFLRAAKQQFPRAIIALLLLRDQDKAENLFFSGDEKRAFQLFEQQKTAKDIFYTAMCLKYGIGTDKNENRAFKLLQQSNNYYAKLEVGKCYETGIGVAVNKSKALEFFRQAAKGKIRCVAFQLGRLYEKYYDIKTAIKWYKLAAANGDVNGIFKLGELYFNGTISFFKNHKKSFSYFIQAAKMGHIRALYRVGDMYYKGLGIAKNRQLASAYWQKYEIAYKQRDNNTLAEFYWKELPTNIPIRYNKAGIPILFQSRLYQYSEKDLEQFFNIKDRIKYYREFNIKNN
jgi:TPR repeat protein